MYNLSVRLTFASLVTLALFTFTSLSLSALSHILIIIPGAYFLFKDLKEGNGLPKSSWTLLFLVLIIILSVLFNLDIIDKPHKNIIKAKYFLLAVFWVVAFRNYLEKWITPKQITFLLWGLLISTSLASFSGLIGLFSGFNPLKMKAACHATRACGVYGMYMTYGYGVSLFLIVNLGLWIYRKRINQFVPEWLILVSLIINGLGLYFSYARGGFLGFLLAAPFFLFRAHFKKMVASFIVGGAVLMMSIIFIPKVNKMFLDRAGSNSHRIALFKTAFMAFKEKPLLGYGYKNFEPNVKKLKEKYDIAYKYFSGHAHNNYLEHLASTGIVGALTLFLFISFWFLEVFKRDDVIALITLPFIVNFSVSGLFQYTFGDGENLFLIMGLYAISMFYKYKRIDSF